MKRSIKLLLSLGITILFSATFATIAKAQLDTSFRGEVSYYHDKFNGRLTACGRIFDNESLTCAHKTLPFGTILEVTNIRNGKSVVVKVTDRGPYSKSRVVDLSKAAARKIGILGSGVAHARVRILNPKEYQDKRTLDDSEKYTEYITYDENHQLIIPFSINTEGVDENSSDSSEK